MHHSKWFTSFQIILKEENTKFNAELIPWFNSVFMLVPLYKARAADLPFQGRVPCGILQVDALGNLLLFVITSDMFSISLGQNIYSVMHKDSGRWLKRPAATVWQTGNIWYPSLGENSQSTGSPRLFNNSVKSLAEGSKLTDSVRGTDQDVKDTQ